MRSRLFSAWRTDGYSSGAKLGAMTALPPLQSLIIIGAAWAVAMPLLYRIAKMIDDRFHGNEKS